MVLVGLGAQKMGSSQCGLWSCRTGRGSVGIRGHGHHCTVRESAVDGGSLGTDQKCSSLAASGTRSDSLLEVPLSLIGGGFGGFGS